MKMIDTGPAYGFKKHFDAEIDRENQFFEEVGVDRSGNYILHRSSNHKIGNASSPKEEFYVVDRGEYVDFLEKSRENKLIGRFSFNRLLKKAGEPLRPRGRITSFETVTLRLGGMRHKREYEILLKGEDAEISLYEGYFSDENDGRVPEKRATCSKERFLKLMNDCRILSWNGFHGKHPRGVKDGTTFGFSATVNGGVKISANGSQNFPRRFRDFTDGLYGILNGKDRAG